jgi:hypothetical protein
MKLSYSLPLLIACANAASAAKPCAELAREIAAKLDAAGVKGYSLEIVPSALATGEKVVGSCEGGTRKITYAKAKKPADAASKKS